MTKKQFKGKVNGVEFTDMETYNAAVEAALKNGQPISAAYTYEEVKGNDCDGGCKCDGNCDCKSCKKLTSDEIGYLLPRYCCGTMGGDLEKNEQQLTEIQRDLDARYDEFEEWYNNNTCECEIERVCKRIDKVTTQLLEDTEKIANEYKHKESEIKKLKERIEELEIEKSVLLDEGKIVDELTKYYEDITDLFDISEETVTSTKEIEQPKEINIHDETMESLIEKMVPELDKNSKDKLKKYANDLVEQFNNIMKCF